MLFFVSAFYDPTIPHLKKNLLPFLLFAFVECNIIIFFHLSKSLRLGH